VKRIIMSLFILTVLACLSGMTAAYAQGKGPGSVSGGPTGEPRTSTRNEHGKTADHQETKSDQNFESRIESNPQLKSRIEALLPAGMNLKTAAMGFRNQGQFIAALHVSKNLNISFDQLKAKVTGNPPESLGKAIQDLRPNLSEKDAKTEVDKAEKQAKETETTGTKPTT
jgi:hypothetical protein